MQIAIIGCGNMGMAYATSFLNYKLVNQDSLLLIEKDENRKEILLKQGYKNVTSNLNDERIKSTDLFILAVKPQDFNNIAPQIKNTLNASQIVISIMAGKTIPYLQQHLQHNYIVRAMPNAPAIVGMGITAYTASNELTFKQIKLVENLLNTTGRSVLLDNEEMLDAVTAVSGSGPAYFYYFVKSMIEAAQKLGFDESTASLLVKQTMLGAFHVMNGSNKNLDELIQSVASKGGTTEAALQILNSNNVSDKIVSALLAAEKRAKELANS